jgi:hypothetical protein
MYSQILRKGNYMILGPCMLTLRASRVSSKVTWEILVTWEDSPWKAMDKLSLSE